MPTTITLEKAVQSLFETLPGIALVPLSRDLARRAVEIAIRHRLRGVDAILVDTLQTAGRRASGRTGLHLGGSLARDEPGLGAK